MLSSIATGRVRSELSSIIWIAEVNGTAKKAPTTPHIPAQTTTETTTTKGDKFNSRPSIFGSM